MVYCLEFRYRQANLLIVHFCRVTTFYVHAEFFFRLGTFSKYIWRLQSFNYFLVILKFIRVFVSHAVRTVVLNCQQQCSVALIILRHDNTTLPFTLQSHNPSSYSYGWLSELN